MGNFVAPILCAEACNGTSSMFAHGMKNNNEYGCFCETSAKPWGTCDETDTENYNLYKYDGKSTKYLFGRVICDIYNLFPI